MSKPKGTKNIKLADRGPTRLPQDLEYAKSLLGWSAALNDEVITFESWEVRERLKELTTTSACGQSSGPGVPA